MVSVAVAAILGGLVIAWVLFVPVADWLATHDVGPVTGAVRTLRLQTARDAARGRLLTLGAGVLAAGALWFTARNFTLARRQLNLSRQAMELTSQGQQRTLELTEQGQVTDRFTRAIEQLGSDKLDVRIGGIYGLERVARDSPRDHSTVMEVLAAFVREHSPDQVPAIRDDRVHGVRDPQQLKTRADVEAAMTVIGRRDSVRDVGQIDLSLAVLHRAPLDGANLAGVLLVGADLTGARLSHANLAGAILFRTELAGAFLTGANLALAIHPG